MPRSSLRLCENTSIAIRSRASWRLAIDAFSLNPGIGLYVLATALTFTAFLAQTRLLGGPVLLQTEISVRRTELVGSPRAVAHPGLPRIRTCAIDASGSSDHGFVAG